MRRAVTGGHVAVLGFDAARCRLASTSTAPKGWLPWRHGAARDLEGAAQEMRVASGLVGVSHQ